MALWPGNYPAGHYAPLFAICGPLLACMLLCLWMAIRATRNDRKGRRSVGTVSTGLVGTPEVAYRRSTDPQCKHRDAVPVDDVDGNRVAWLCIDPDCGEQLPGDWTLSFVDRYADESLLVDS